MGSGTDALNESEELGVRIGRARESIARALEELDRRRREVVDMGLQLRLHPLAFVLTGSGFLTLLALGVWGTYRRRRRELRLIQVRRALLLAYGRPDMLAQPVVQAPRPPHWPEIGKKVAGSALSGAARVAARHLTNKALERL